MPSLNPEPADLFKLVDEIFKDNKDEPDSLLDKYNQKIIDRQDLSPVEAREALKIIMSGRGSDYQKAQFLTGLKVKGETVEEIASFASTLREMAEPVSIETRDGQTPALGDTCGTGGGSLDTFNVSTAIMFILAAAGMVIAKHGNRAITSKCGSADVLTALGVRIDIGPVWVGKCISQVGLGFIYAPTFHRAFKNIQPVRRKLPYHTVFNILGPLANPAFRTDTTLPSDTQVLGVNRPELTEKMAQVLKILKLKRAMVVHGFNASGQQGMDELSTAGSTKVTELNADSSIENYYIEPEQFGIKKANPQDLTGGEPQENAQILSRILAGEESGPRLDLVLLNAAAGLYVGGVSSSIRDGISLARARIENGSAQKKLAELIEFTNSVPQ